MELCTRDGLVKERTQCAPNGYYFIPVYDKGSFILRVKGPAGWSWLPEKVPVTVDHSGCNANADINFKFTGYSLRCFIYYIFPALHCTASFFSLTSSSLSHAYFCRFMISGRLLGPVGGDSCQFKNRGPSGVRVELLTPSDDLISHVSTSDAGDYSFPNVIPGQTFSSLIEKTVSPLCHPYTCTVLIHIAHCSFCQ